MTTNYKVLLRNNDSETISSIIRFIYQILTTALKLNDIFPSNPGLAAVPCWFKSTTILVLSELTTCINTVHHFPTIKLFAFTCLKNQLRNNYSGSHLDKKQNKIVNTYETLHVVSIQKRRKAIKGTFLISVTFIPKQNIFRYCTASFMISIIEHISFIFKKFKIMFD